MSLDVGDLVDFAGNLSELTRRCPCGSDVEIIGLDERQGADLDHPPLAAPSFAGTLMRISHDNA
jgi:hypothetical protein